MEAYRDSSAKAGKRRKGGKAARGSFTLKLPKFEDPTSEAEFMMYTFKVALCTRRRRHTWSGCPYAHPGETARRRDPRTHCAVPCPEMKQGQKCPRGDQCPYSHHDFEYWLHPTRYRTVCCNKTGDCGRSLCFFYHGPDEQRATSSQNGAGEDCGIVLPKDELQNKVEHEDGSPQIPASVYEEGVISEEDEGSSSDLRMASFTGNHASRKAGSCSTSSHSTSSTHQMPSDFVTNQLNNSSGCNHVPPADNLASMQIQNLLANAVKAQGTPKSSSILTPHGRCPSIHSHGSGSPTSTFASYMGGSASDEVVDMSGGNASWGNMAANTIDISQMRDFIARRQSAPTVMGMSYHEAVQLLQSASQEPGDHLQGLLGARGSTCPSWAPASMGHSVQTPQTAVQEISHIEPQNNTGETIGQTCFEQKAMGMGEAAYMDSPFVVNSDMTNAALMGARWDLLGHSGVEAYSYGGWGPINASHSVGVVQGAGYQQGAIQNSASCALMGMLGMETN